MKISEKRIPWTSFEKNRWLQEQTIKRPYKEGVLDKIEKLKTNLDVINYGSLSYNHERYPLKLVKSKNFDIRKKTVLITGGVHGYETSGVHGTIRFLQSEIENYVQYFNFICFPCVSPWSYETVNRWNPYAIDPNRSFFINSPAEECQNFTAAVHVENINIFAHFDLHETTNTDNTIFRPMLAKRDGKHEEALSEIPDGFYLVGDLQEPQPEFQKAIIENVKKITHIAPPDENGNIIGEPAAQEGVINYDKKKLFLCGGFSKAQYVTTTEVYPDSLKMTDALCVKVQVEAIKGGLDYLKTLLE